MSTSQSQAIKAVILDIEGTTAPISFVHEVLFPYARERMTDLIENEQDNPEVREQIEAIAEEVGRDMNDDEIINTLLNWIDEDQKIGPLKVLQGIIWAKGYEQGDLKGPIYSDAAQEMQRWEENGLPLYIYSSGSVQAQKLIFGHSDQGDLTMLLSGYFDTKMGHKQEVESYQNIQAEIDQPAESLLFLSDVDKELDAASEAGWQTGWIVRDGHCNDKPSHPQFVNFRQVAEHFGL